MIENISIFIERTDIDLIDTAGDSAGALFVLRALLDSDMHSAGMLLISPWVRLLDFQLDHSWTAKESSHDIVSEKFLKNGVSRLVVPEQTESLEHLRMMSPLNSSPSSFNRLPPVMITYGKSERLSTSIQELSCKFQNSTLMALDNAVHDWVAKKLLVHPKLYSSREQEIQTCAQWIINRLT